MNKESNNKEMNTIQLLGRGNTTTKIYKTYLTNSKTNTKSKIVNYVYITTGVCWTNKMCIRDRRALLNSEI